MKDSRSGLSESLRKFGLHRTERRTPSRAYERFFENYEETREAGRVVRRYRGDYRLRPGTARGHLLRSLVYLALWLLSAGLLVLCAVQPLDLNRRWYSAAPQAIAVGALGFVGAAVPLIILRPGPEFRGRILGKVVGQPLPVKPQTEAVPPHQTAVAADRFQMSPEIHTLHLEKICLPL